MRSKKRIGYEFGGDEDNYTKKCAECKHSYTRQDESDTLFCGCRKGCNYEKIESEVQNG